jgi:peptidoglycan/LPS O-acetylase OafA/YrhL
MRPGGPASIRGQRPTRPTAAPRRELRQRAAAATIFGLLSLLALSGAAQANHALYLVIFALAVGLAAGVLGVSAAIGARRESTARPRGAVAGVILGGMSIALSLLAIVAIVFSSQLTNYEQCVNKAHTTAAQQACTRQMLKSVQSHYGDGG